MPSSSVVQRIVVLALAVLLANSAASAQSRADTTAGDGEGAYGSGLGGAILLTNSGFGLGGYYHRAVSSNTSFMVEASLGAGKDERELKFFRFGSSYIPNKANYLLMMPVQIGVVHRLFRDTIEDNFRPYVQVSVGPTFGWEYPYFDDLNRNGSYDGGDERIYDSIGAIPKGDIRLGYGGALAIGAHFGSSRNVAQGIRIGYAFTRFRNGIQLLEPQVQDAQRFFGTPTITLTFGKLL
ncbi:MAG: hypothetical protein WD021_03715 [Rhodothermales bacterium]